MRSESKSEKWFSVEVTAAEIVSEAIEFAFNELDSLGNEINNLGKTDSVSVTVIGYFNELPNTSVLKTKLDEALDVYGFSPSEIIEIRTNEIENEDWLAEWKKHWKPSEIGGFIVTPPWEEISDEGKFVISIEPNMAFGTGTHETTRLCLLEIERLYQQGMSFLDVGTGTGILSIAVAKFAENDSVRIVGCDVDEDSVEIAKQNVVSNGTNNIEINSGSISSDTDEYDFVCANMTVDIIVPILPILIAKSRKILLISGILKKQEADILLEMKKLGFADPIVKQDGEWISLSLVK